jgi:hypothetical protein
VCHDRAAPASNRLGILFDFSAASAIARPLNFTVRAQMILIHAIVSLALRVATVALITCVAFLMYLFLSFLGVPLHSDPVVAVLAVAGGVAWRLYRGNTPSEEIRRFAELPARPPTGSGEIGPRRSNASTRPCGCGAQRYST